VKFFINVDKLSLSPRRETYSQWIFFFFLRFYLRERVSEQERERESEQAGGEGEAGSPLSMEPGAGLDPRTPVS